MELAHVMKSHHTPPASCKVGETFPSKSEDLKDRGPLVYDLESENLKPRTLVSEGRRHQAWEQQAEREGVEHLVHMRPWL